MIILTAEIADGLLAVKDSDNPVIPESLKSEILRLADLSLHEGATPEPEETENELSYTVTEDSQVSTSTHIPTEQLPETVTETVMDDEIPVEIPELNQQHEDVTEPEATPEPGPCFAEPAAYSPIAEIPAPEELTEPAADQPQTTVAEEEPSENGQAGNVPEKPATEEPTEESTVNQAAAEPVAPVAATPDEDDSLVFYRNVGDLQKAFSLNDVFLFRREIFGGSQEEFNNALLAASLARDMEEYKDFLATTLNLNLRRRDVKDFIATLEPYF